MSGGSILTTKAWAMWLARWAMAGGLALAGVPAAAQAQATAAADTCKFPPPHFTVLATDLGTVDTRTAGLTCTQRQMALAHFAKVAREMSAEANELRTGMWTANGAAMAQEMADVAVKNSLVKTGVDVLVEKVKLNAKLMQGQTGKAVVAGTLNVSSKGVQFAQALFCGQGPQCKDTTVKAYDLMAKSLKLASSSVECSASKARCAAWLKSSVSLFNVIREFTGAPPAPDRVAQWADFVADSVSVLADGADLVAQPDRAAAMALAGDLLELSVKTATGAYWRKDSDLPTTVQYSAELLAQGSATVLSCAAALRSMPQDVAARSAECVGKLNDYLNTRIAQIMAYAYTLAKAGAEQYSAGVVEGARVTMGEVFGRGGWEPTFKAYGVAYEPGNWLTGNKDIKIQEAIGKITTRYQVRPDAWAMMNSNLWSGYSGDVLKRINEAFFPRVQTEARAIEAGQRPWASYAGVKFYPDSATPPAPATISVPSLPATTWDAQRSFAVQARSTGAVRAVSLQAVNANGTVLANAAMAAQATDAQGSTWALDLAADPGFKALPTGPVQLRVAMLPQQATVWQVSQGVSLQVSRGTTDGGASTAPARVGGLILPSREWTVGTAFAVQVPTSGAVRGASLQALNSGGTVLATANLQVIRGTALQGGVWGLGLEGDPGFSRLPPGPVQLRAAVLPQASNEWLLSAPVALQVLAAGGAGNGSGAGTGTGSPLMSAQFVRETVPDGTALAAGAAFNKTWELRNTGTQPWAMGMCLRPVEGEPLGSAQECVQNSVAPGATYAFTVAMQAPAATMAARAVRQTWQLMDAQQVPVAGGKVWVQVQVAGMGVKLVSTNMPEMVQEGQALNLQVQTDKPASQVLLELPTAGGTVALAGSGQSWSLSKVISPTGNHGYTLKVLRDGVVTDSRSGSVFVRGALTPPGDLVLKVTSAQACPVSVRPGQPMLFRAMVSPVDKVQRVELVFTDVQIPAEAMNPTGPGEWVRTRQMVQAGAGRPFIVRAYQADGRFAQSAVGRYSVDANAPLATPLCTGPAVPPPTPTPTPTPAPVPAPLVPLQPLLSAGAQAMQGQPWSARLSLNEPVDSADLVFASGRRIPFEGGPTQWVTRDANAVFSEPGAQTYELQIRRTPQANLDRFPGGTLQVQARPAPVIAPSITAPQQVEQGKPYNLTVTTNAPADKVMVQWPDTQGEQGLRPLDAGRTQWEFGGRLFMQPGAVRVVVRAYKDGLSQPVGESSINLGVTVPAASMRLLQVSNNIVLGESPFFTVETSLGMSRVEVRLGAEPAIPLTSTGGSGALQQFRGQVPARTAGPAVPYVISGFDTQGRPAGTLQGTVAVAGVGDALNVPNPIPAAGIEQGDYVNWRFGTSKAPDQMWMEFSAPIGTLPLTGAFLNRVFSEPPGNYSYRLMRKDYLGNVFPIGGASGTLVIKPKTSAALKVSKATLAGATVTAGGVVNVPLSAPLSFQAEAPGAKGVVLALNLPPFGGWVYFDCYTTDGTRWANKLQPTPISFGDQLRGVVAPGRYPARVYLSPGGANSVVIGEATEFTVNLQ